METEDKNRNVTGATKMFCKESLRKINAKYLRAFPERFSRQILLLESVDHFGTIELTFDQWSQKEES